MKLHAPDNPVPLAQTVYPHYALCKAGYASRTDDSQNVINDRESVTCGNCLRILKAPPQPQHAKAITDLRAAAARLRAGGLVAYTRHEGPRMCALGAFETRYTALGAENRSPEALAALTAHIRRRKPTAGTCDPVAIANWSNAIARKTTPERGAARVAGVMERLADRLAKVDGVCALLAQIDGGQRP